MTTQKKKKQRPTQVKLDPQPGWNLGRHVTVTITNGGAVPHFLQQMIVKSTQGGSS